MNRSLAMALGALFASTAFAQRVFDPLMMTFPDDISRNCKISCHKCQPEPGEVNICSQFYTFKVVNPGNLTRIENTSELACGKAVEENLTALTAHYGARPEISLPTQDMAKLAEALAVPAAGPLPFGRMLEKAQATDSSLPLESRIRIATSRIMALTGDAGVFADVAKTTGEWETASNAALILIKKASDAGIALALARPWPTMREFMPEVWGLYVCKRNNPAVVARLVQRLADEKDDAWSFAFYEEWVRFQKPFGTASTLTNDASGPVFASIASPFFAQAADTVKIRSDKTLFTAIDVRAFKAAVEKQSAALVAYVNDRHAQLKAHRIILVHSIDQEKQLATAISTVVTSRQEVVEATRVSIASTTAAKAKTSAPIAALEATVAGGASVLAARTVERDQRRTASEAAADKERAHHVEVDAAQRKLDAIVLDCGSVTYDSCKDANARREYDRQRYAANAALAVLRNAQAALAEKSSASIALLFASESAILAQRGIMAQQRQELAALINARDQFDLALDRLTVQLQQQEDEMLPLALGMAGLAGVVQGLDAVRPK